MTSGQRRQVRRWAGAGRQPQREQAKRRLGGVKSASTKGRRKAADYRVCHMCSRRFFCRIARDAKKPT